MFTQTPIITNIGKTLLLRAVAGEQFTFTKFQVGNGTLSGGETPETAIALKHPVLGNIGISKTQDTEDEGYLQLSGTFDNQTGIESDFLWTELGLIAEDEDGNEYLYAYGYDNEHAEFIRAGSSSVIAEQTISMIIAVGETDNITAQILPNVTYTSKQEFNAHLADEENPHHVTAAQAGAAPTIHTHSANDIVSGVLPVARGGTGASSLDSLKGQLGVDFEMGFFIGDGTLRKNIVLGYQPRRVFLIPLLAGPMAAIGMNTVYPVERIDSNTTGVTVKHREAFGGTIAPGENLYRYGDSDRFYTLNADSLFNYGHGGAAVTTNGFAVGYYGASTAHMNIKDVCYLYIALKPQL